MARSVKKAALRKRSAVRTNAAKRQPAAKAARKAAQPKRLPYYNQSTGFTCGAASLLMAMKTLDKATPFDRLHELQIWREANTVFMGKGHAGSSPYGIALAAWRRGFHAEIWLSHKGPILSYYQSNPDWLKVGRMMQEADERMVRDTGLPILRRKWDVADLAQARNEGAVPIVLVNTRAFHGDNTPHWVIFAGADAEKVYINDPWISREKGQTARSQTARPATHKAFMDMAKCGPRAERAVVLIRGPQV
ncbi:peptidase C3-like protein [Dongia mobilis]|uniref:Peptidase C3-like protein n=1 Tax=Dongia mobilis TaxID=578943 RepID=A0A4R6WTG9_9PROT|nr:peptidase C39 family protein [Dongia mobilis]TDQ82190.1 peptidase C3-like protein [Dongia mobilis]